MMLTTLIKTLILPPGILLILLAMALLLRRRWRWLSHVCLGTCLLAFWLLSLPIMSDLLHRSLMVPAVDATDATLAGVGAIVVLGVGRHYDAQEYGGDTLSHSALWRLRYAAYLAKRGDLPVVVSGGNVHPFERVSEAQMAVAFLRDELDVAEAWPESRSRNTWENAQFTKTLLEQKGITRVALVTHAYHMPRAMLAFTKAGIDYIPMPTGYLGNQSRADFWLDWLPSAAAFNGSCLALHEWLGLLYYRLK